MASPRSLLPRSSHSRSFRALIATHHFQRKSPLDQMLHQCTLFLQSLTPLWQSACDNAADSLQQLSTNKQFLSQLVPWRVAGKYLQSREEGSRLGRKVQEEEFLLGKLGGF